MLSIATAQPIVLPRWKLLRSVLRGAQTSNQPPPVLSWDLLDILVCLQSLFYSSTLLQPYSTLLVINNANTAVLNPTFQSYLLPNLFARPSWHLTPSYAQPLSTQSCATKVHSKYSWPSSRRRRFIGSFMARQVRLSFTLPFYSLATAWFLFLPSKIYTKIYIHYIYHLVEFRTFGRLIVLEEQDQASAFPHSLASCITPMKYFLVSFMFCSSSQHKSPTPFSVDAASDSYS